MTQYDEKKNIIRLICHQIEQPIGVYYQTCIEWKYLKKIIKSQERMYLGIDENGHEIYRGIQRKLSKERQKEIHKYILEDPYATFPTSIIINLSSSESINVSQIDFKCSELKGENLFSIEFKLLDGIAQIIDGQHRISGFDNVDDNIVFDLPISIFIDLTLEKQADLFAIINGKQTRVSPSLVMDLFGLSTEYTPYRVSNDIIKILNEEDYSPIKNWVKILGKTLKDSSGEIIYKGNITQSTFANYLIKFLSGNMVSVKLTSNFNHFSG